MGELDKDGLAAALAGRSELDVLVEQLDELLAEPVVTSDDALEVATVAGLAWRLGASESALSDARQWLVDGGNELVEEGLDEVDWDELVDTLDNLEGEDDHVVEEALSDFDDLVAAAAWVGQESRVRSAATRIAAIVRMVPDPFAFLAPTGEQMMRSAVVARDLELYDYWLAVAQADSWS